MRKKLLFKIVGIISSTLFFGIVLLIISLINSYKREINNIAINSLKSANTSFTSVLENETQKLSVALDLLMNDKQAKQYFINQQIDSLYTHSKPVFELLRNNYDITHTYYIMPEPDKTCFLRMHNPAKNNDTITRITYKNAIETKTFASGLELGKTAFALRVVHPYFNNNNQLIGYMEVGEEIDHFFDIMKSETGNDFVVTVEKKFLNEDKWKSAQEINKSMTNWNHLTNDVILTQTTNNISIKNISVTDIPKNRKIIKTNFKIDKKIFIVGLFPLYDAGNRKVGAIYFTHDITKIYNDLKISTLKMLAIFIIVLFILGIIILFILHKIIVKPITFATKSLKKISQKQINFQIEKNRTDEIGELYKSINEINNNFNEIIKNIDNTATTVMQTSKQLSNFSQEISKQAGMQASTTEEISASMEQMLVTINSNTENANITSETTAKSSTKMKQSNKVFLQTINSVSEISKKIIIISEIANKTNILSINAAIEAANAGKHGKGFGVVAQEIRKLSDKTKTASIEIETLSESGKTISQIAGKILKKLIPEIVESAQLIKNIAVASQEQQQNVEAINISIQQLTDITNQNSASSEEMSSSAEELFAQAERLKNMISIFTIETN